MPDPTAETHPEFDVYERPVISTPYDRPKHHWKLDPETGAACNELRGGRRSAGPHRPVPGPRRTPMQSAGNDATYQRINNLRALIEEWTRLKYPGVSPLTRQLLDHWDDPHCHPRPYFPQKEAIRTLIWLHEAGPRHNATAHHDLIQALQKENAERNDGIDRVATKMATGTGKTLVMQMTIAWLAVNHEGTHPLTIVAIAPNTTVRDRLEELEPGEKRRMGHNHVPDVYPCLVPQSLLPKLRAVRIIRCNFQQFQPRDTRHLIAGRALTKAEQQAIDPFGTTDPKQYKEQRAETATRLLEGDTGPVIILNDEAHHCYRIDPPKGRSAKKRDEKQVALWFNFLTTVNSSGRLQRVYDFSATPAYLKTATADRATRIFEWTVSDYPLVEAAEAGLVKIPRNPVAGDTDDEDSPFRRLYENAEPKTFDRRGRPPHLVSAAIKQLYDSYSEREKTWTYPAHAALDEGPPVFIVVTPDIGTAKSFYRYLAGSYDPATDRGTPSEYPMLSNCMPDGTPREHPPTLLVHSQINQADDKQNTEAAHCAAAAEIHLRGQGKLTKGAKLNEVRKLFRTVGRPGTSGSRIRCVISVSMLTEGWDAKNVTHILGYRAFDSELLCEQVIGRGLRRKDVAPGPDGYLNPDLVEVYGIPFDFIPLERPDQRPRSMPEFPVHPLEDRAHLAITMPLVHRYRHQPPQQRLILNPNEVTPYDIHRGAIPTVTVLQGVIGRQLLLETPTAQARALIAHIATQVLDLFLARQADDTVVSNVALFRAAFTATEDFLRHTKVHYDSARFAHLASPRNMEALPEAILAATNITSIPAGYIPVWNNRGAAKTVTTADVKFDSANPKHLQTTKSHLNLAICDSQPELLLAKCLEADPLVAAYVRNVRFGFTIPFLNSDTGYWGTYVPDFIVRLTPPKGIKDAPDRIAIVEFKGEDRLSSDDTKYKAHAARNQWCPAVNAHCANRSDPTQRHHYGYVLLHDPQNIATELHRELQEIQDEPAVQPRTKSAQ